MDFCKDYSLPDWTSGFEQRKTSVSQLPYEEYIGPMEKSASDANNYRLIRLPNNLVVMCAQDAETETAAAALSVDVGSNMDPVELQGLAHFLEHMLFMGTEKYPDENEFLSFISEHGGNSNASTQFSRTKYYFEIANGAFEEALDRFSSFFTSSLFKQDCMDRELCAVDSEFKGLLNKDFWHSSQLARKLGNPEHPFSKFLVGNIESLKQSAKDNGLDLHEELLKFYNKYYSSDIMKLVVCGNHSMDQLVEWAAAKFSGIKSNGDNVERIFDHPLSADNLGKAVYVETIDDKHTINITFPVPYTKAMYRHDPFAYIAHLIGHEGQGSIKAYLRKQGWAANLSASANTDENKGFAEFSIYINSAPEGLEHYVDVLHAVFAYVQMLVASGPQEWIYLEIATLRRIMFDSRKKPTVLACVLNYLHLIHNEYVAPEHALSKDSMYETFNYDDILHCLSFINPNNFRVFLGAAKHKSVDCTKVEPYFGTRYHVDSISSDLLIGLASDATHIKSLCLPERNVFMPNDFTVKSANMLGAAAVLRPTLLKLNDNFELWFKQDDQFATLKGSIMLSIKLPTANTSPMKNVMSTMYCNLLDSSLCGGLCNAKYAGLSFQVRFTNSTIEINVAGFTSKLPDLLMAILERVKSFTIDETHFVRYCADYHRAIGNIDNFKPIQLGDMVIECIEKSSMWNYKLMQSEVANVTPARFKDHVHSLFDVTFTKMVMVGNFNEDDALKAAERVQGVFKPTPNLGYNWGSARAYDFEPGYYLHQVRVPNTDCLNSAVLCEIYCGSTFNIRDTALLEVLGKFAHESFFAQLRTKHQLGYSVSASTCSHLGGRSVLSLQVEGEPNPMYVTLHINKFIDDMQQRLVDMTNEQFNNRVQSLIKQYQERVKNIYTETMRYLREVKSGTYEFALNDKKVKVLQTVAKEELLEFWNKYVNPSTAPAYTRIDVQMWSAKIWKPSVSDVKTYSAKTLALYGCLKSEGNDGLDISKVDEFICKNIVACKEQVNDSDNADTLVKQLKSAGLSESGAAYMVGESSERAKHTSTALELAIKDYDTFGNYSEVSRTNFATIGMSKTPDGMWLMEDYRKFQATQQLHGLGVPAEVLVPKYSS